MFTVKTNKQTKLHTQFQDDSATKAVSITFLQAEKDCYLELTYPLDFETTGEEYVLFPACCYRGNQFDVLKKNYPPMFTPEEATVTMPITMTDVIRLNKDGSGKISVTTGDVSVPCVGVFSQQKKRAILLFTIQEIEQVNLGLSYEKGKIGITYPHMRLGEIYRWPFMKKNSDVGMDFEQDQTIQIPYKLLSFDCEDLKEFYQVYFENRKCMGMDDSYPDILPFDEQFKIQKDKFNLLNWTREGKFYGVGQTQEGKQAWQAGWCGGAMSSYALMKLGGALEWYRGMATLEHLFRTQAKSGFFYGGSDQEGNCIGDAFDQKGCENWHLIRRSSDVLYFLFKHFELMNQHKVTIPQNFIDGTKKLADAFVTLWKKYGQFGQFVDVITGEIIAGGSTSAAIAPAGLVSAYRFFNRIDYLKTAEQSAEFYYTRDALNGYTTGGPGEILQCPDSESAFGLLESFVELYDVTKEQKWLEYSEYMLHQCSSWVVSYNYKFPPESEFGKLGMKTIGSVFANAQNKHSAPGICTLSGNSIYKLYRWTNNKRYLELAQDISLTISQYMSTEKRPIYSWDVPKDASLLNDDSIIVPKEKLPSGFICERVNLSDWESTRCIGGVFNGSCWPEVSNLLMLAEVADQTF